VGRGSMPSVSDVHIYLEVPCRVAFPWAKVNIVIPNQEWWYKNEWAWVFEEPSCVFFYRSRYAEQLFRPYVKNGFYISWRCPDISTTKIIPMKEKKIQALYIVGGSVHKSSAAQKIVKFWQPNYPPLILVISKELSLNFIQAPANVQYITRHISDSEKTVLQNESLYHVVASSAEGFGYTMAEAINFGSLPIWTDIPVYLEVWGELLGELGKISTTAIAPDTDFNLNMLDTLRSFDSDHLERCINNMSGSNLEQIINNFSLRIRNGGDLQAKHFKREFQKSWKRIEALVKNATEIALPPKMQKDLPTVGVVTLVYNRPEWFKHAVRNIETCEYPRDKLVWVIVDDSDGQYRVDIQVQKIQQSMPNLKIAYVSSGKKIPIGEKRNRGCATALKMNPATEAFAFMDDDDHYPKQSLLIRILFLLKSKKGAVYCSTLPMYHINKYISAINVPPLNLAPSKRISEATICCTRKFWEDRNFENDVSMAEGEGFIAGREVDTIEIPPEGVIVSFLHGKNSTSRRVPEQKEANGCHYGFSDEYFTMISQIADA
jgi:hypothetical protein